MDFLKSAIGANPVDVEGLFPASVAQLYQAWTEADQIKVWFGPSPNSLVSVDVDVRVGGHWRFVLSEESGERALLHGEYLEVEPEARLSFSWAHLVEREDGTREETPFSTVTVDFEAEGKATRVRLRHEGASTEDARVNIGRGWPACFTNLSDILTNESHAAE